MAGSKPTHPRDLVADKKEEEKKEGGKEEHEVGKRDLKREIGNEHHHISLYIYLKSSRVKKKSHFLKIICQIARHDHVCL